MIRKFINTIRAFTKRLKEDDISAYAAQAAFFIILSGFPFLMLLLTLIKYTPLTEATLLSFILDIIPRTLDPLATEIIEQLYSSSNITLISITAVVIIWSSGKGIMAIIRGMNSVHQKTEQRNYFIIRIISAIYTVLFILAIVISLGLIVFGNNIYNSLAKRAPLVYGFLGIFIKQKITLSLLLLILFFLCLYKIVPDKEYTLMNHLPGAVFSSVTWIGFSFGFSVYVENFSSMSTMYGSLSTLMLLMLWLYICMYLMFIGGEINVFFKSNIEAFYKYLSERYHNYKS